MESEVWRRAVAIARQVRLLPPVERRAAVERDTASDARVGRAVLGLLDSLSKCPDSFLCEAGDDPVRNAPTAADPIGDELERAGFRLGEEIGRGASGVVFRGEQIELARPVALKIFRPGVTTTPQQIARFRAEAEAMARLQHPGITGVLAHGRTSEALWIAMELVDGRDLAADMELQFRGDARAILPLRDSRGRVREVARVAAEIAEALQFAHERGVTHRDVKPQNVLLHRDGRVRLVDFGMARYEDSARLSRTGEIIGSPYYMSPEQVAGDRAASGPRSDVYAVGVVLYEMLTGRVPFDGPNVPAVLASVSRGDPAPPRRFVAVPQDIETICLESIARDPSDRYATAGDLAADLRRFTSFEAIVAARPSLPRRLARTLRRRRVPLIAAIATIALTVILGVAVQRDTRRADLSARLDLASAALHSHAGGERDYDRLAVARDGVDHVVAETVPGSDLGGRAATLQRELASIGTTLASDARARVDAFLETSRPSASTAAGLVSRPGVAAPVTPELFAAIDRFGDAARLLGSAELAELAELEGWFPRLSITSDPAGAEVVLQPIDWIAGDFLAGEVVGRTPLEDIPVVPGYYRVAVVVPGFGHMELTRWLGNYGGHYDLGAVRIPRTADVIVGMQEVAPSRPEFMRVDGKIDVAEQRGCLMDTCEVSNSQFAAFLAAVGSGPENRPGQWDDAHAAAWPNRPVVGVSALHARRYAEWAGKRLPTQLEWAGAVHGVEGRAFPWGDDPALIARAAIGPRAGRSRGDGWRREYEQFTVDVGYATVDRTPEGFLNLAGNVAEWTDSPAMGRLDGQVFPLVSHHRVKGWNWRRQTLATLAQYTEEQGHTWIAADNIGFRCAKSIVVATRKD